MNDKLKARIRQYIRESGLDDVVNSRAASDKSPLADGVLDEIGSAVLAAVMGLPPEAPFVKHFPATDETYRHLIDNADAPAAEGAA